MERRSVSDLQPGQSGIVCCLCAEGAIRRRFQDIGLIEGTEIFCLGRSPWGDPTAYLIRGAVMALRNEDGQKILIH